MFQSKEERIVIFMMIIAFTSIFSLLIYSDMNFNDRMKEDISSLKNTLQAASVNTMETQAVIDVLLAIKAHTSSVFSAVWNAFLVVNGLVFGTLGMLARRSQRRSA